MSNGAAANPPTFWTTLQNNVVTIIFTTFAGILTIFSGYFTEHIKTALNRSDQRRESYEKFCTDLSTCMFQTELMIEYLKGDAMTNEDFDKYQKAYNTGIESIRLNEYRTLAWAYRYWGKETAEKFNAWMTSFKNLEQKIRELNNDEMIRKPDANLKTKIVIVREKAGPIIEQAAKQFTALKLETNKLLEGMR